MEMTLNQTKHLVVGVQDNFHNFLVEVMLKATLRFVANEENIKPCINWINYILLNFRSSYSPHRQQISRSPLPLPWPGNYGNFSEPQVCLVEVQDNLHNFLVEVVVKVILKVVADEENIKPCINQIKYSWISGPHILLIGNQFQDHLHLYLDQEIMEIILNLNQTNFLID